MKRNFILFLALIGILASTVAAQDLSDTELLVTLDEARFFDASVTQISTRIQSETPDETREAQVTLSFFEAEEGSYARIEFVSPEELAGQIFLSTPDATYFYGPDLDFPIKTSATQEVFGDAAVAQTSGIRFAESYTIGERRSVTIDEDIERWEIDLIAVDFTVAFQAVTVTVDPETLQPVSALLYAVSGLPFYEVFYETYETQEEDMYVTKQRIVNKLLLGRVTTSEILEISTEVFPFEFFDPGSLGVSATP